MPIRSKHVTYGTVSTRRMAALTTMLGNRLYTYILRRQFASLSNTDYYYYSVALVRERTIPTDRPPLVGEVSANLCGQSDSKAKSL
jgi:hypothetical protein